MNGGLIDTSALVRLDQAVDPGEWVRRINRGLFRITTVTRLEVGIPARSGNALRRTRQEPALMSMPVTYLTPTIEDRAVEVQALLADRGSHRAPSIPHLIVAAAAELSALTVLHVDNDFDLIAEVTGQAVERLALS